MGNHITIKVNGKTTVDNYVDKKDSFKTGHFAFQQHDPGKPGLDPQDRGHGTAR